MVCYKRCNECTEGCIKIGETGIFAHSECSSDEEKLVSAAVSSWHLHYYYSERIIANNDNGIDDSSTSERIHEFTPEECIIDGGEVIGFFYGEPYLFADKSNHEKRISEYEDGTGPLGGDVSTTTVITFCPRVFDLTTVIGKRKSVRASEFMMNKGIKEILIPSHVTHIGRRAFLGCTSLTAVDIPDSVTSMDSGVFFSCEGIVRVKIGSGLSVIPEECFQYCGKIESVEFCEGLRKIEDSAFAFARSLREIRLPDSTEELAKDAFYRCDRLERVILPARARVGRGAFRECGSVDVYYKGTRSQWEEQGNSTSGEVYFLSESEPAFSGSYWHFVGGEPTVWKK